MAAFHRILVGFDGSDGGRDALALAQTLALSDEARVTVVTVFPYGPFPISFVRLQEEAARDAAPLFAEARETLGDLVGETRVFGGGSPAWVITHLAEDEKADLIVVGSPHRGAVGRVLLGSVATNLLHGSPCPVAVAPRGYAAGRRDAVPRVIAVAYDGTAESKAALHQGEALARDTGASLRLLTVIGLIQPALDPFGYVPPELPRPDEILAQGKASVAPDVQADSECLTGPPAPTLAAACEDGVDVLLVGSRGYGAVGRVVLGSVSTTLIHEAPCPVIVTARS